MITASRRIVATIVACFAFSACDRVEEDDPFLRVYEVDVAEQESFRIALATAAQVDSAEHILQEGRTGVILGELRRGDGGFNVGYRWHIDPETVTFPDFATEVCDGRPRSDVEANLDYWVDTVGTYCPWGARILRRVEE